MPVYCYQTEAGEIIEEVHVMGSAPKTITTADGQTAKRCFAAENSTVPPTTGWPMECVGSGVNSADRGKLETLLKDRGVPTKVSADGNPIYNNANHRKKALKARGFFDKNAYS